MSNPSIGERLSSLHTRIQASSHARIANSALIVLGVGVGAKVVAVAREMYVARVFGAGDQIDAFAVAFLPLAVAANLISSFNGALIPVYVRVLQRDGERDAGELVRAVSWPMLQLLAAVSVVFWLVSSPLLRVFAPGFAPWKHALALRLYYEMLPIVVLSGVAAAWSAVLNARDRYALPAGVPVAIPIGVLTGVAFAGSTLGIDAVALGTTAGYLVQAALLASGMRRQGLPILPSRGSRRPEVSEIMAQYAPLAAGTLLLNGSPIVDQMMASLLPAGSIAALNYGNRIASQVTTLVTLAVGTAVLPAFSRLVADAKWGTLRRHLKLYGTGILAVTVPATIAFALLSHVIVAALYQRGAFTAADTDRVAFVQAMYVLQVPLYTLGILFVKVISASGRNRVFIWANLFSVSLNAILDYALMKRWGAGGIALSTSIVYSTACVVLGLFIWFRLPSADPQGTGAVV